MNTGLSKGDNLIFALRQTLSGIEAKAKAKALNIFKQNINYFGFPN